MEYNKKQLLKENGYYNYFLPALNESLLKNGLDVDEAWDFCEGFSVVKKNEKYNYIKPDGSYLLDDWVDLAWKFSEGSGVVKKGEKWNYVKPDGTFLLKEWADNVYEFQEGFGEVNYGDKWNYIKPDGTFLLKNWVEEVYEFSEEYHDGLFADVVIDGELYIVDREGNLYDEI